VNRKQNYYELIGISRAATHEEIIAACLRLGDKYRPDRHSLDPKAVETFALLEAAFEVLSDPEKRAGYDASLAAAT
jgi:molecular chaperone DnaJ